MNTALTQPARYGFDNDQIAVMKRTVARECSDAEFLVFTEIVARYRLDPFAGQIYAVKMPGRNGQPGPVSMIVSRDGLLAIANRYDDFRGMTGDVVRAGDMVARTPEGFVHTYEAIEAEARTEKRVVGAWTKAHRAGRVDTFFFAVFGQYVRGSGPWKQYPDAMILKVAESMALRKAFSISGLIPEDEIGAQYNEEHGPTVAASGSMPVEQEPDWGEDPELAERLRRLFDRANEVRPMSFTPQKIRLQLAGADRAKRAQIAQDVASYIIRHGGELPDAPSQAELPVDEKGAAPGQGG